MKKILLFFWQNLILLAPIIVMLLYAIIVDGTANSGNVAETCELQKETCVVETKAPEKEVEIKFLEDNYQSVIDQKYGNIPLETFRERVEFAIHYRSEIQDYLETDSYRYSLSEEAKEKVRVLIDENSYANTVNNIHKWVSDNIEYTYNREWYTAQTAWQMRSANCNGISFLACGMIREAGIPCVTVANDEHAWTEYLYVDDTGRLVWSIWDQGIEGYSALSSNIYEYDLN